MASTGFKTIGKIVEILDRPEIDEKDRLFILDLLTKTLGENIHLQDSIIKKDCEIEVLQGKIKEIEEQSMCSTTEQSKIIEKLEKDMKTTNEIVIGSLVKQSLARSEEIEKQKQTIESLRDQLGEKYEDNYFSNEYGDLMLSQIDTIFEESEFSDKFNRYTLFGFRGECPYEHIWNKSKTKGIILERYSSGKAHKGLLTSQYCTARKILPGWRMGDTSALGWNQPFGRTTRPEQRRWQFDMRGKNKEEFRKILRRIIE